jgi:hypothetical protein
LDIVREDCPVSIGATLFVHGLLKSLQKLFFCGVKIFNQRSHPVKLRLQVCILLLFRQERFLNVTELVLSLSGLLFRCIQLFTQFNNLNILFVDFTHSFYVFVCTLVKLA